MGRELVSLKSLRTLDHRVALILIVVSIGVLYLITMPRVITLEDAGIFQMTCHLGGISHPPGYPLFTGLCQLITFGDSVVTGNLVSLYFALAAVAMLYFVVLEMSGDRLAALCSAAAYGLTRCLWSQGIIIEVYSLAAFQFLLCWWLLLKYVNTQQVKYWFWFCFCAGLALSNHWPLFLLSCLGFLSFLIYRLKLFLALLRPGIFVGSVFLLILGLTPYLYLFQSEVAIAMYGPVNQNNFVPYVLREYYDDNHEGARWVDKLQYLGWLLPLSVQQSGWIGIPLVVLGLVLAVAKLGKINALSIILVYLGSTIVLVMLLSFRYEAQTKGVFLPYPVVAMAAFSTLFGVGMAWLLRQMPTHRVRYAVAAAIFACVLLSNFSSVDRSYSRLGDQYGRLVLDSLPEDAFLLVSGDNQIGPIGYLNRVVGVRSDVIVQSDSGLLFSDNILPRRFSSEERAEVLRGYARKTGKRVFSIERLSPLDSDYGLYYEFEGALRGKPQVFLPEIERFTDHILDMHFSEVVRDSHERVLVHSLMISISRMYAEHASVVGSNGLSEEKRYRYQKLLTTLPGKLSSLRAMIQQDPAADGVLDFAFAVESQLEESIAKKHDALVFEFIGHIFLARNEPLAAEAYFQKSLARFPASTNAALCEFTALSQPTRRSEVLLTLELSASHCLQ